MGIFLLIVIYSTIIVMIYLLIATTRKYKRGAVYRRECQLVHADRKSYFSHKLHNFPYITNFFTTISRFDWKGYTLFLKVEHEVRQVTFSYVHHNIGYAKFELDGVMVDITVFLPKDSSGIFVLGKVGNTTQDKITIELVAKKKVTEPLIYLTKNIYQRTTYFETSASKEHMRFFALKTSFYKKENEIGQVGVVEILPQKQEKFACILGGEKQQYRSVIEIENLIPQVKSESISFCKKYLTPKRKAMLIHYIKKSERYTFEIVGKEKFFTRRFFEDSFLVNGCDPYYPIFVAKKWGRDEQIVSKLLLNLGTNIQLIPLPDKGKMTDYQTVMATNLNVPIAELKKKSDYLVRSPIKKFKPLVLSCGIQVEEGTSLKDIDRLKLYPTSYMYTTATEKQLKNYLLHEHIAKVDNLFVKGDLNSRSTNYKDFFVIKVTCDDMILTSLVNDLLPKQIMEQYKKEYHFQSLYDYVFKQDITQLDANKYMENVLPMLKNKEYARAYCYLTKSVLGVEIVGNLVRTSQGSNTLPFVQIKICDTILEKYQKDGKCVIKCNQMMYQNVGVFKIKKGKED